MTTDKRAETRRAERELIKQGRTPNPPTGRPNRAERRARAAQYRKEQARARARG